MHRTWSDVRRGDRSTIGADFVFTKPSRPDKTISEQMARGKSKSKIINSHIKTINPNHDRPEKRNIQMTENENRKKRIRQSDAIGIITGQPKIVEKIKILYGAGTPLNSEDTTILQEPTMHVGNSPARGARGQLGAVGGVWRPGFSDAPDLAPGRTGRWGRARRASPPALGRRRWRCRGAAHSSSPALR